MESVNIFEALQDRLRKVKKEGFLLLTDRERSPADKHREGDVNALALGGFQELFELLRTHALLGVGAPLDAGRADGAGVQMAALLALGLGLIAPDLDLLAALLAPDVLRFGLAYLYASRASFFEHGVILLSCS
jgi:hypothetical protein